jgi:hypothetical protein
MDVNLSIKNVTGGILIFIVHVSHNVSVSHNDNKVYRPHKFFRIDSKITNEIPWP